MADTAALQQLYRDYYHTADLDAKTRFFAFDCKQVCRPRPDYAACDKAAIVRLLQEAPSLSALTGVQVTGGKSFATIRSLSPEECTFACGDACVQAAGFDSATALHDYAVKNNWVGLRVDMWDVDEADNTKGSLIKVQYWWAFRFGQWTQVLHDILYIGPLDGTQGEGGQPI
ncbi:hypothetical protein SBRCBS47491_008651 [Sporothrix bragantina]|uniref:SnoaL-like domain-containing protein n=1 Tax=Sporothrix bragantina TaxID=671064 RepID=A0ABP0CNZ6_9PEZI